jgi:hypothetical protein
MKLHTILAAIALTFAAGAFAQTAAPVDPAATPRIDKRQAKQERRIDKGIASGSLNGKEAARLEKGQDRVDAAEDKAKADGKVTRKERARLTKMQDKQSKRIHNQKHDAQTR